MNFVWLTLNYAFNFLCWRLETLDDAIYFENADDKFNLVLLLFFVFEVSWNSQPVKYWIFRWVFYTNCCSFSDQSLLWTNKNSSFARLSPNVAHTFNCTRVLSNINYISLEFSSAKLNAYISTKRACWVQKIEQSWSMHEIWFLLKMLFVFYWSLTNLEIHQIMA